ncbi:hypothetical protein Tco_1205708, partial [Tanacetum coccineum]
EEQPNERTSSPPPRKKSLSPPQASLKSISSKSTDYTSSSSPSESPTPTYVSPPPKLYFVILIKLEPQELPPPQMSPNDPYAQTKDNWPPGPSNPSPPPLHEVVMEKDSKIYKGKKEQIKSITLKAKKESSDDETSTSGSDDEEYAMVVRNFIKCVDSNHLIGDCPKPSHNKDQKAFSGGSWSDSENDAEDKTNNKTCLMAQSSNEVILNSSYYSDNATSLDNDNMQTEYDNLCKISLKIINKNKILKTKRDLLEKEILELNEKIKKIKRSKEIEIACKSCDELKSENAKLKETQVKFVKFHKSANTLREMLDTQKSSSCKIGLGFDNSKESTSGTKIMSFVRSSAENATDESIIRGHGSTIPGSVSRNDDQKGTEHVFSLPLSSRSDFVITRKKLIHNSIDVSNRL